MDGDLSLHISTKSFQEWRIFFYGFYEEPIPWLIRAFVPAGGVAIDVGANIGAHTLVMWKTACRGGRGGVVVACEPNPLVLDRLRANLKLNRANEVIVSSAAILDREADVDFFIPSPDEPNQMIATLGGDAPNITHPRRVQIPGITLDLLMDRSEITTVDLIKIDVEGFEEFVLAGARTTLRCHRPNLIFEYAEQSWTRAGSSLHRVLSDLRAVGYGDAFYLARDGLKRLASAPPPYTDIVVPRDGRAPRRRHSPEGPQTG